MAEIVDSFNLSRATRIITRSGNIAPTATRARAKCLMESQPEKPVDEPVSEEEDSEEEPQTLEEFQEAAKEALPRAKNVAMRPFRLFAQSVLDAADDLFSALEGKRKKKKAD